jgi:hypothetical protein
MARLSSFKQVRHHEAPIVPKFLLELTPNLEYGNDPEQYLKSSNFVDTSFRGIGRWMRDHDPLR